MWMILLFIIFLPIILVGALVTFLFSGVGENWLKSKIEQVGSQQLPSDIKVDKIQLDFFQQGVSIEGLTVSHPRGGTYTTPHMLRVNSLKIQADLSKLLSREVHLLQASIASSDVFFEGGLIDNNLKEFLNKLTEGKEEEAPKESDRAFDFEEAMSEPDAGDHAAAAGTVTAGDQADDFDVVAEKVEFLDSGVSFKLTGLPDFLSEKTEGMRLAVPDYTTSIGGGKKSGDATKEISENFVSHLVDAVLQHLNGLMESLPAALGGEVIETIAEHIPGPLGDLLGDNDKEAVAGATGMIADILDGDDDDKSDGQGAGALIGGLMEDDDAKKAAFGAAANLASGFF